MIDSHRAGRQPPRRPAASPGDRVNLVIEVATVLQALAHPVYGETTFKALMVAFEVNQGRATAERGRTCFCCDRSWRQVEIPVAAAMGTVGRDGVLGLICEDCAGAEVENKVKAAMGELFGCRDARRLNVAPGGRA